ncbi:MAG: class I SAM-dependent RNA methyltransferase [Myxococcales bacterium]
MKVDLYVQSLVHGGEALARHEGRVVFLRGAAPGDRVEADLTGEGRFERARALRILERGAAHVDAPCPIVDRCGGCPLQHVAYGAQLAAKQELAADALERIGGFARGTYQLVPIVPSPEPFRYRRRARLHRAAGGRWGFAHPGAAVVEPVEECLLFEPLLQDLAAVARTAGDLPSVADLGLLAGETKGAIDLRVDGAVTPGLRRRAEKLLEHRIVRGVTLGGATLGDPVIADAPLPNGSRVRARPDTFAQANRSLVPELQREVALAVGDARRVLELYCGSGTLTLPLLGGGRAVAAAESSPLSLSLLRRSADEAGLPVKLIAGEAFEVARTFDQPVDAVLLDPPRTGAAEAVRALAGLRPPRVVYVSCDAPTLARDGKLLAQAGYRLERAAPLDLFPQTAHFEIVATFAR